MARRYNVTPWALVQLPPDAYQFNLLVAQKGVEEDRKANDKAVRAAKAKRGRR